MKDLTKFKYNGEVYNKGRFILAVIKDIIGNKNYTIDQLQDMFPKVLNGMYEVVAPLRDAKKVSTTNRRYFINNEDIITLKNGDRIAITNQWTSVSTHNICVVFKKVYKIKFRKI